MWENPTFAGSIIISLPAWCGHGVVAFLRVSFSRVFGSMATGKYIDSRNGNERKSRPPRCNRWCASLTLSAWFSSPSLRSASSNSRAKACVRRSTRANKPSCSGPPAAMLASAKVLPCCHKSTASAMPLQLRILRNLASSLRASKPCLRCRPPMRCTCCSHRDHNGSNSGGVCTSSLSSVSFTKQLKKAMNVSLSVPGSSTTPSRRSPIATRSSVATCTLAAASPTVVSLKLASIRPNSRSNANLFSSSS
mmetsp:Transcript_151201/g.289823  ORF Transcript_151201/g.289823 Transcript_151201/m.289823 type:complete len:250 (-) Transcript_151201:792-1541(-)